MNKEEAMGQEVYCPYYEKTFKIENIRKITISTGDVKTLVYLDDGSILSDEVLRLVETNEELDKVLNID